MPKRIAGEPLNEFLSKFMGSKREKKQFPSPKQRLAVGFAEAKEASKRK